MYPVSAAAFKPPLPNAPLPPLHEAAQSGDVAHLSALLSDGADVDSLAESDTTALYWAAAMGQTDAAEMLLDAGADPNLPNARGETPLWASVRYAHAPLVRLLLNRGASRDIYLGPDTNDSKPPSPEIERMQRETLQVLDDHREQMQRRLRRRLGEEGAAAWQAEQDAKARQREAERKQAGPRGAPLLTYAVRSGSAEIVRALLEAGEKPVAPDGLPAEAAPLNLALTFGTREIVAALLEHGADPNAGGPLTQTVFKGDYDMTRLLLEAGADPNHREEHSKQRPVDVALLRGDAKLLKLLMDFGGTLGNEGSEDDAENSAGMQRYLLGEKPALQALVRKQQGTEWLAAVEAGDLPTVRAALERGADPNARRDDSKTALLLAIERDDAALCALLIERGANVNLPGEFGRTPLIAAIVKESLPLVRLLVRAGADINQAWSSGHTPLYTACAGGRFKIADLLEAAGATVYPCELALRGETVRLRRLWEAGTPIDQPNPAGMTALTGAVSRGNLPLMTDLLERGASLNHADNDGHPPLYYAVMQRDGKSVAQTVRFLLARGANPQAADKHGRSLINIFLMGDTLEAAGLLLDAGAPVGYEEGFLRQHLMHSALMSDSLQAEVVAQLGPDYKGPKSPPAPERMRLLLDHGGDPNAVDYDGETLLTSAIKKKAVTNALLLVERGADVNLPNENAETPLAVALKERDETTARHLLKAGADVNPADAAEDITPLDIAERTLPQLVPTLRKRGAQSGDDGGDPNGPQAQLRRLRLDALTNTDETGPLMETVSRLFSRAFQGNTGMKNR